MKDLLAKPRRPMAVETCMLKMFMIVCGGSIGVVLQSFSYAMIPLFYMFSAFVHGVEEIGRLHRR